MRRTITRELPTIAAALLITASMAGCASSVKIRSDFDHDADYSQYQTYNFYADAGPDNTDYQSLFSQHMVAAITKEMDARGYEKSDNPDLLINFNAIHRGYSEHRPRRCEKEKAGLGGGRCWPGTRENIAEYRAGGDGSRAAIFRNVSLPRR